MHTFVSCRYVACGDWCTISVVHLDKVTYTVLQCLSFDSNWGARSVRCEESCITTMDYFVIAHQPKNTTLDNTHIFNIKDISLCNYCMMVIALT